MLFVFHVCLPNCLVCSLQDGKYLTVGPLAVMFSYVYVTSLCGVLGQACYLIVSIP